MNVGHGLRALLGTALAVCLGVGCAEEKAASGTAPTDAPRERSAALVGTPFQVREILPGAFPDSFFSPPTTFVGLGNLVLFGATDKVHGRELWRTDGTAAGTSMVLDLMPGPEGSDPSHAVAMNGRVYFLAAATGYDQSGLWSTDGTAQGTVLVKSLRGQGSFLEQRGGVLYIGTTDPDSYSAGFALWRSDGTPAGTVRLRREHAETGIIGGHSAAFLGDTLLFTGMDDTRGMALWTSDGTAQGTRVVKDLLPGFDHLSLFNLTPCGEQVFFWTGSFPRFSLWRTDGSEAGTVRVKDIELSDPEAPGNHYVSRLVCLGGSVYFSHWDAEVGTELWKSDGSQAGTARVEDLFPGTRGSFPRGFTAHAGAVYFVAEDGEAGIELWKTDGTPEGTGRVADVAPGTASSTVGYPDNGMISSPEGLFFFASDGVHGRELWKTNGTAAGTVRVSNNTSTRYGFRELQGVWSGGALHFWSQDDELWKSTGTAQGTGRVRELADYARSSITRWRGSAASLDGTLFFTASSSAGSERLWRSNGTANGTTPVGGSTTPLLSASHITRLEGRVLVAASDASGARWLWSVDTSTQAPRKLTSIRELYSEEPDRPIVTAGGQAWFVDWDTLGDSVWKTDGTPEGTRLLRRGERFTEWHPRLPTVVGTQLYFVANTGWRHEELWTSDGTEAGTRRVVGLDAPERRVTVHHMLTMNGRLYFWATTEARGLELWTSDGTAAGTRALGPVLSVSWKAPAPRNTAVVNGTLFYTVEPEGGPPELWKTDGGAPVKVRTFGTTERVNPPSHFSPAGNMLLFWADDGTHGYQPWRSDGTEAGTVMVKNLRPGGASAVGTAGRFTRVGADGPFVFSASDGLSGQELWRTDGTAEGTVRVADIAPGVASSTPQWMVTTDQHLFFPAWTSGSGVELWAMRLMAPDTAPPALACPAAQVAEAVNAQGAPVSYAPATVTDADPSPTVVYSHASGAIFPLGTTDVRVTATDSAGNAGTCAFSVTVRDTVAPALECPSAQSAVATSEAGAAVEWPAAQASDAVSPTVTVGYAPERGSVFSVGTTEVRATATDASGNSRSCTFEVSVQAAQGGNPDGGSPDGGSPDGGSGAPDAGTSPPPPPESSGCGCQQSGGAGTGLFALALLGLLSARRRRAAA
jgi:ELWxxDGT repeat protein